jgi:hypothetical protein
MSWQAARAALDLDSINPTAKFVLIVLCLRAGADGRAWPSVATIAADTGYADRAVRMALGQLRKGGHIDLIHRQGRSSLISVNPGTTCRGTPAPSAPTPAPNDQNPGTRCTQKYKEEIKEVAPAVPSDKRTSGAEDNGNGRAPGALLHDYEWVELDDGTVERRWLHGQSS